jgi:hypothetical protein
MSNSALANPWYFNTSASATKGAYSGSLTRDQLSEAGISISGDYLEAGGVTLGLGKTLISMKNSPRTDQNNLLLSGRLHYWLDTLPGKLTVRADGYRINNNDVSGNTGGVSVFAPQVSWLSNDAGLYADLGYAGSRYQNQLNASQYTPTIGMGFNHGADWLQLRAYLIRGLNPARAANKTGSSSLDTQWTHFFVAKSGLLPSSVSFDVSAGESIYAVDMDAQSVANLADIKKGSASLSAAWKMTKRSKFFLLAGQSRFQNVTLANNYKLNVAYASVSVDW